jgi:hypothetical protein
MSGRIVLHIGAMKSGTSFIQSVLLKHPEQLAAAGAEFLGTFGQQMRVVQDGLKRPSDLSGWRELVGGARDDRTSIVSMEFLSFARPNQVAAFLEPLQGRDVQVVLTVRDQLHALPAQWQSHTRNYGAAGWGEYLRQVCVPERPQPPGLAYRTYHRAQDLVTIADRWATRPEVGHLAVVTVPRPGSPRDELWSRFSQAVGITVPDVCLGAVTDNASIGYASCDVLRQLNRHLFGLRPGAHRKRLATQQAPPAGDRELPGYRKLIRQVVQDALAPLRNDETRPVLDCDAAAYALARNRELRELTDGRKLDLVGSADDLPVATALSEFPKTVTPPPSEHVLRAAEAVWDCLARATAATAERPAHLDVLLSDAAHMLRSLDTAAE